MVVKIKDQIFSLGKQGNQIKEWGIPAQDRWWTKKRISTWIRQLKKGKSALPLWLEVVFYVPY